MDSSFFRSATKQKKKSGNNSLARTLINATMVRRIPRPRHNTKDKKSSAGNITKSRDHRSYLMRRRKRASKLKYLSTIFKKLWD
ncbi:hypothetical protein RclHR1_01150022 [Rhizophagus clarus]|uniref:Uncharacterized protein n=1 Tax=Rhizophagus clarus TaxID=94130 RepID=A0A2Z6QW78_9GLOM|nr:hypothetical protein RclHR1_01150022 [Rhizophagus clarus]GES80804.1 hypothetical protein RCL_e17599_RclHR1_01150022 [Rhizophagus clarus]